MNPTNPTLPRAQYSASFPTHATPGRDASAKLPPSRDAAMAKVPELADRASAFLRTHWKKIGLAALGLLGWRSARMRPLVRKAAMLYALPLARNAFARARR